MTDGIRRLLLSSVTILTVAACQEMPAQSIDGRNDRSPVGMSLDSRDFQQAALSMVGDMLASDRLQPRPDGQPRVMAISRITNDTALRINTNELTQTIRRELSNSGRIVTTTAVGLTGPLDPMAIRARELRASGEFNQRTVAARGQMVAPDLSLSGQILQTNTRLDGRAQRIDYRFQLTLTNIRTGVAVWEGEEVISRIGSANTVNW